MLATWIDRLSGYANGLGTAGVSVFIVISGALMAVRHYEDSSSHYGILDNLEWGGRMYKKGIRKFYPLFLITFIPAALLQLHWLIKWPSAGGFYSAIKYVLPNLLLVNAFIPSGDYYYSYNVVSWYLCDILFFYFITPFLLRWVKRLQEKFVLRQLLAIIIFYNVAALVIYHLWPMSSRWCLYISPYTRTIDYACGMLVGRLILDRKSDIQKDYNTLVEYMAWGIFIGLIVAYRYIPEYLRMAVVYLPFTLYIVYMCVGEMGRMQKLLSNKFFVTIGNISMEAYLVHQIVIRYISGYSLEYAYINDVKYYFFSISLTVIVSTFLKLIISKD